MDEQATIDAKELLATRRQNDDEYRDPTTKFSRHFETKSKVAKQRDTNRWIYSQAKLDSGLQDAIRSDCRPSVVAACMQLGAKVNLKQALLILISKWTADLILKLLSIDQHPTMQTTLNQCLTSALTVVTKQANHELISSQTVIIQSLLTSRALVPPPLLSKALRQSQFSLAETLLRSPNLISESSLSSILCTTIQAGRYRDTAMLLAYQANPDFNSAQALDVAITTRKFKIAVALLANAKRKLSKLSLASCLKKVLDVIPRNADFSWLKLLLTAGAASEIHELWVRLYRAVINQETETMSLLVDRYAPIDVSGSNAL